MDVFILEGEVILWLWVQIGIGVVMSVWCVCFFVWGVVLVWFIEDWVLIDVICLYGKMFEQVLVLYGWSKIGCNVSVFKDVLWMCLDWMCGFNCGLVCKSF